MPCMDERCSHLLEWYKSEEGRMHQNQSDLLRCNNLVVSWLGGAYSVSIRREKKVFIVTNQMKR